MNRQFRVGLFDFNISIFMNNEIKNKRLKLNCTNCR